MEKVKEMLKTKKKMPQSQASAKCYMVFSTPYGTVFPIADLIKGEFDQGFVGKNNVPNTEFNRYPIYATLKEAINNSSNLSLKPECVYIVEMGANITQITQAAAQGKLSQFIIQAFSRHDLVTQKEPVAIANLNYNQPISSTTSLIKSCNSPLHGKKQEQQNLSPQTVQKPLILNKSGISE